MGEEFDEKYRGNPRLMDTFKQYTERLKRFVTKTIWPPGTKFECKMCGDCCTWNFYQFKIPQDLEQQLKSRNKNPHGYWILSGDRLTLTQPYFEKTEDGEIVRSFFFKGVLPPSHLEFHRITQRKYGYWVLQGSYVINYSPTWCIHLNEKMECNIYDERPRVCRRYWCGKYPIIP